MAADDVTDVVPGHICGGRRYARRRAKRIDRWPTRHFLYLERMSRLAIIVINVTMAGCTFFRADVYLGCRKRRRVHKKGKVQHKKQRQDETSGRGFHVGRISFPQRTGLDERPTYDFQLPTSGLVVLICSNHYPTYVQHNPGNRSGLLGHSVTLRWVARI